MSLDAPGLSSAWTPVHTFIVLLRISLAFGANHINSYAGPFEIIFREAMQCPQGTVSGPKVMNLSGTVHNSRANGMIYDGEFNLARKVDKGDLGVKLSIAKWDTVSGWRENFFRMDGGELCLVVKTIAKEAFIEIHRQIPRIAAGCPLASGHFPIRNLSLTAAFSRYDHFPVFPYGRFRGDLGFYDMKSKQMQGCISGVSDVVPKTKNK